MSRRHVPVWTLLGVILVAALLIGSGAFSSAPPTAAQRAAAIESVIRCPSCEDLSVAVSSAPTAVTVRATVSRLVDQGQSDRQIKDYLVARYGSAIVLDPPASGWSALVWILPIVVAIAGIAVLVVVLVRRRKGDRDLDADIRGESADGSSPSRWPMPMPSTWPGICPMPTTCRYVSAISLGWGCLRRARGELLVI